MMLVDNPVERDPVLRDLTEISVNALKDLELARKELKENDLQMQEMNKLANERVNEMSRVNQQLQDKISFVENMTKSMQEKNEHLEKELKITETEKINYSKLNALLKEDLSKVIKKEKELSIKQIFLEKKVKEQAENLLKGEKMSIIGTFTSRLAHDIRNPLSKLKMSHDILCNSPNMPVLDKIKHQQRIESAISNMTHIIEDVLEFVRMSELDMKETPIKTIIKSSMESITVPSSVKLEIKGDDRAALCDSRKLEAVFVNLLTNAIEAIRGKGYVAIKIMDNGNNIEICFEDSGAGVIPSLQGKIFEPMFTTKQHGTGLGLAICKMIVEQHGGKLLYKNTPSAFSVLLPKINNHKMVAR
ncbi:sensor histidine kinase [Nitrosopumilus adriaticus]|uniref:Signal transduction histidine kinase n=1 Tax=Nitrosopumilus adriaticus TaxID=1580092 RepID=A0A0D5C156_9ARCH|nr:HAMP domain-containing sensor histidine kinase [Nitrosopumilus adriaticus]AJW70524.1 Signal transduction histidine kinase [Nitrosopumilus adriaticus]